MEPNIDGLKLLRVEFPPHQISKLPKGTKAQNECDWSQKRNCGICGGFHHPDIKHLDYVGHAALTDRLLDADPAWGWEPLAMSQEGLPVLDPYGGMWIRLTVCGVTRLGYGNPDGKEGGNAIKEVIGDALRNAAMRFGAALDLWHKGDLHVIEQRMTADAIAAWVFSIKASKNAGEMKRILGEAIAAAEDIKDDAAEAAFRSAAAAKVATAKTKETA